MMDASAALALLAPYRSLLIAVSGGPDSVALMRLCAQWPERGAHDIAIATVDHGLRAESRREAECVADWARALDFPHHLLTWEGEKPTTRIQERARAARYALLAQCAAHIGAQAIVTAHHAEDQAETILFRLTRGSGVAGLAGMAPASRCGSIALLRPLLGICKQALLRICADERQPFLLDSSNNNEAFARARLRKLAPVLAAQGLTTDALLRLGARAARADEALEDCARRLFDLALRDRGAAVTLDAEVLRGAAPELLQRTLALAMQAVDPATPRLERLERAAGRLNCALRAETPLRLTLANVLIDARDGKLRLRPAPPRGKAN